MALLTELNDLSQLVHTLTAFSLGVMDDDLSREHQIDLGARMLSLAERIRRRGFDTPPHYRRRSRNRNACRVRQAGQTSRHRGRVRPAVVNVWEVRRRVLMERVRTLLCDDSDDIFRLAAAACVLFSQHRLTKRGRCRRCGRAW